uniref:Nucleoprotein TPR n=3 Tax=Drosophila melanogaster TaxID=7227 RepID=TPR_DROME|nr:megator, isoform B [Drosophila melanogaster]NP_477067.2 megator, isoform A [Drosophila melanogaster]A1Z8P9.1 RecName: Full=Nucleoprotein TPR; AltName: Full=Megator; AltName: Full=Nuclear envelope antigen Bx34 [Drosophila melanogaster]AAF58615.1 megator, isoform A [Drosophila melanogaster]AGB93436.1 megator, isoform B [Drosophila melanogaster]|eukprot:NP_001260903.1 megator, isoform B [Drosophila melanogaster]
MDLSGPQTLNNILQPDELKLVPEDVQKKLSEYINNFSDEYCKNRAAANRLAEAEQKKEELENKMEDYLVKFTSFELNVNELRTHLDQMSSERVNLMDTIAKGEQTISQLRKEKASVVEERDSMMKVIERQQAELERLKQDLHTYQQQLSSAIAAKCEAIARVDEIQSKEVALELKENRMESERDMLHKEILLISGDLNKSNAELQNIRREHTINTMQLQSCLKEKTESLKLMQEQYEQAVKTIGELTSKIEMQNDTAFKQNQATEEYVGKLKKELDAKEKLFEIFKSTESDHLIQREELLQGISEIKRLLEEAEEQCAQLTEQMETMKQKHSAELDEQNKKIQAMEQELASANDLLKQARESNLESAICQLAPSAAVASRLIRSDLSLTELYSMYAKSSEELEMRNCEIEQLKLQLKSIIAEISESAPILEKQNSDYQKMKETNSELLREHDELLQNKLCLERELERALSTLNHNQNENKKLKQTHTDLSRQVCMLLDELNCIRAGVKHVRIQPTRQLPTSESLISDNLVTFSSIEELVDRNTYLLNMSRELTELLEASEKNQDKMLLEQSKNHIRKLDARFAELEDLLTQKNNTVTTLLSKCDRYKKLYFAAQKKLGQNTVDLDDSNLEPNDSALDTSEQPAANFEESRKLEKRVRQLEQQLEGEVKKYASLKENYDYYTSEKRKNDALAQEQFDSMRKEVRELTSSNCKLMNTTEFQKEQIELLHKNIGTYKQQVTTLEERTKNYEKTIIKHEQTVHLLKDEMMAAHRKHAAADAEAQSLRQENRILRDTSSRLQIEKETYHREQQSQSLLLNSLEFIKTNLERSEMEGRQRLEQRLDDTVRELAAQRRHFQEEEEKFRESINEFKRQAETAIKLKDEEKQLADKWQAELTSVREELAEKVNKVNELSKKLQEVLTPTLNDNPITAANKRAREFELKLDQATVEIESLTKELAKTREHGEQFYKMSQSAESEIKRLHELHGELVAKQEEEIKKLRSSEAELKTRISDLEAEAMLSNVTEQSKTVNQSGQLKSAQDDLKSLLEKLTEANCTIRTLRSENTSLVESLNAAEVKYANGMIQHSADIQELTRYKAEFFKANDELNQLKSGRESLQAAYDELLRSNAEAQKLLDKEREESEKRVADLHALNSNLHDQIEALASKLAVLASQSQNPNSSLNESAMDGDQSLNASGLTAAEEGRNNEQLLKIIKFLRKEKDLFAAKLDILKAENARLISEHAIQQKKVDELNGYLNQERAKSQTDVVSANKHEEVLRKIETLNAITDSNRILREERNALTLRVAELTDRISSVEKELFPLQCSNKELTSKIEEINVENTSLRTEAIKWRQRANALVEKSNRNPEEFKRLQAEREHLAKLLTAEKELNKKQSDELTVLKQRMNTEIPMLNKQMQILDEARKKQVDEFTNLKQNNTRQTQDIMELKNRLLQKEEELLKANEELETKDKTIADKETKELQLRKLAKRYKDFYIGLQSQGGGTESAAELEKVRSELEEVNNQLRALKDEHEKITKECDEVKKRTEPETDTSAIRQEYKAKLDKLVVDLTVARTDLVNQETTFAGTKSSYDETIARLEKELQENIAANKDINQRLTRENESLHMRINQLTRQLGSQQSTKPSTSSVAEKGNISESSPRTANVKPMSGSATVQQSATVTPWRGGETPLASIRPISVQNSRTAAILPTSQQPPAGSSTSTSSSSSSSSTSTTSAAGGGSSAVAQTALVPPQQQVHTTGSAALESMASSSPTSSHTDYMPSTSSASVAVAAIPPMGASSAAESSQEAESIQHPQQNDSQLFVGGAQQQVVALVSPRVEGSSSSSSSTSVPTATAPSIQDGGSQSQQPSTSGSSSSSSTVVSSHSRHTPSSSNVTTTQAGCSSQGIKRPRDIEGDSSTGTEEGVAEKMSKITKRLRGPMHSGELSAGHIGDSGMDVDQMPTSSQRDQEDDIQVVDSDDEEDVLADADDGPIDGGEAEQEGYEDSYEQDNEMDDNEGGDDDNDIAVDAQDNNEVDIEVPEQHMQAQEESQSLDNQAIATASASTQENNQSQAITSGSGESSNPVTLPQAEASNWKQAAASTSTAAARRNESSVEIVSSPQVSNFCEQPARLESAEVDGTAEVAGGAPHESAGPSDTGAASASSPQKQSEAGESSGSDALKAADDGGDHADGTDNAREADEAFAEETMATGQGEDSQPLGNDNPNVGTSQSEVSHNQANLGEGNPTEDSEGADGVSSEGEKQAVGVEEEGREAEATSPSENTRFRTLRSAVPTRRGHRAMRGGSPNSQNRPQRIVWQRDTSPGNIQQNQMSANNNRFAQRTRNRRPIRRPPPNNFNNGGRFP